MEAGPLTDYLTAVGRGLEDVPLDERDELIDEVMVHLTEIAAELGEDLSPGTLRARLGTPQEYVAELRRAAGYEQKTKRGRNFKAGAGREVRVLPFLLFALSAVLLVATIFGGGNATGFILTLIGTVGFAAGGAYLMRKRLNGGLTGRRRARVSLALLVLSCVVAAIAGGQIGPEASSDSVLIAVLIAAGLALLAFRISRADFAGLVELPEVGRTVERLSALVARVVTDRPAWWSSVRPYLRAGWWAVRGWSIAIGIGLLLGIGTRMLSVPQIASPGGIVGLVLIAAAVVTSIWIGRRFARDRRALWYVLPANALALGVLWVMAMSGPAWLAPVQPMDYSEEGPPSRPEDALVDPEAREIRNIYVFDENGRPIQKAFLYDQKGRAIQLPRAYCDSGDIGNTQYPGDNVFPRPRVKETETDCREVGGVPFTVAVPSKPKVAAVTEPTPKPSVPESSARLPPAAVRR